MPVLSTADWIQIAVVFVGISASVTALYIGYRDRKNASEMARIDREYSLKKDLALRKLDSAIRLYENLSRGGSKNDDERKRLGTEALALIAILGEPYVPKQWKRRYPLDVKKKMEADINTPQWKIDQFEAYDAIVKINDEINRDLSKG